MKSVLCFLAFLGLALATNTPPVKSYEGYKVYRIPVENRDQADFLKKFEETPFVDFWTDLRLHGNVDAMVGPGTQFTFE